MSRDPRLPIPDDEFEFHAWPPRRTGGQHTRDGAGVLVTHKPTGAAAVSTSERSQLRNKESAVSALRASDYRDRLLRSHVYHMLQHHPLPWRVEADWCAEVYDARDELVAKCFGPEVNELIRLAEQIDRESKEADAWLAAVLGET